MAEEESVALKNPYASKNKKAKADSKSLTAAVDAEEKTASGEAGTEEEEKKESTNTDADGEEEKKADEAEGEEKKPEAAKLGFFGRMKINMGNMTRKKKPVEKKTNEDAELEDVMASLDEHEAIEEKKVT